MPYTQFSKYQNVRVIESNEEFFLGGFIPDFTGDLEHIRVHLFRKGTASGSETLQLKIRTQESTSADIFASSNIVSESSWSSGANYIGVLRFDFTKCRLNSGKTYYLSLATANYTANVSTFYLATLLNYPNKINTAANNLVFNMPQKFEIFYRN